MGHSAEHWQYDAGSSEALVRAEIVPGVAHVPFEEMDNWFSPLPLRIVLACCRAEIG